MAHTRRDTVKRLAAGLGGALVLPRVARAQSGALHLVLQGFSLGIHTPLVLAGLGLCLLGGAALPPFGRSRPARRLR